jgi:4-amino-4-deoxy-L-arabinose transferase-like glycosyltransferase
MSFADRVRRVPPAAWAAIFAAAMLLPGLGSFGFWDPWELNIADHAREISRGSLGDPTVGGRYGAQPPLALLLPALGMKVFGTSELGARLFGALFGIVAILPV